MRIENFTNRVGDLVGQNNLKEAIQLLHNLLKNSPQLDEVILQSSRLTDLMKQIRNNTISFENVNITKNQIRIAILSLAEEIKEQAGCNSAIKNELQNIKDNNNYHVEQNHYGKGDNVGGNKIVNN